MRGDYCRQCGAESPEGDLSSFYTHGSAKVILALDVHCRECGYRARFGTGLNRIDTSEST